jgi:hypothetical protein
VASEQITVTIRSSLGEDGPLTVEDGLRQILDLFDLLALASIQAGQEVSWNLVTISKSSPLTATAEPYSAIPHLSADIAARRAKAFVSDAITSVTTGQPLPTWMDREAREKTRAVLTRSLANIGRTDIVFKEGAAPVVIFEKTARMALTALDRIETEAVASEPDFSHKEMGSIEGVMEGAAPYYGRPAIRVRDRRTKAHVPCSLSPTLADKIGNEHSLREAWSGRRVIVTGLIFYRKDGSIGRVYASDLILVEAKRFDETDLYNRHFTDGLAPQDYIDSIWSADVD